MEYNEDLINKIWETAFSYPNTDFNIYRHDRCGARAMKSEYQNYDSDYGWDIVKKNPLKPIKMGDLFNLEIAHVLNLDLDDNNRRICRCQFDVETQHNLVESISDSSTHNDKKES